MSQAEYTGAFEARRVAGGHFPPYNRFRNQARAQELALELKLAGLRKDYADLHTGIFEAAQVHRRLCAPRLVRYGDFEIASEILAVRHLPGDFFTVEEAGGSVVLALGDICGKGLAAGMWTTLLVGLVGMQTALNADPQSIVTGVNHDLCTLAPLAPLASLFLARLDPATGELEYCSAGHPPALLLRAGGQLELLSDGGLLAGAFSTASFATGRVDLLAGDVLVVYSDGIVEASNNADEQFGHARLEAELRRTPMGAVDNVLFSVLGAVQDFAARELADDTSLVVVRRNPRK
jgi:sigma-B regulation protein RsbU (phosphoserine phosphatase)